MEMIPEDTVARQRMLLDLQGRELQSREMQGRELQGRDDEALENKDNDQ